MHLKKLLLTLIIFILSVPFINAQNISKDKFGKGIRMVSEDSTLALKFGLRFSTLYEGYYNLKTNDYFDNLLIRRFRLKFDGFALSPKLVYKVEIGVSNRDIGGVNDKTNGASQLLLDAVLKWNATGNLFIWFGQTKLPGNRERVVSSQNLQFVDRSLLNGLYNLDRDIGLQIHNHHTMGKAIVREIFSISKGEGRNITVANTYGYDYTGRLEFLPMGAFKQKGDYVESDLVREPTPKLAFGVTYDYKEGAERSRGQLGAFLDEPRNMHTLFIDMMFKHNGFSAMSEFANRQTEGTAIVEKDSTGAITQSYITGKGFSAQAAYLFHNNFEIAGRFTSIKNEKEIQLNDINQYTLCLSKYIVGHHLKAQTDITFHEAENSNNLLIFRFQIEVAL